MASSVPESNIGGHGGLRYCSSCDAVAYVDDAYCACCGSWLAVGDTMRPAYPEPTIGGAATVRCSRCGRRLRPMAYYCVGCGVLLRRE